jgi:hypothetical protein
MNSSIVDLTRLRVDHLNEETLYTATATVAMPVMRTADR